MAVVSVGETESKASAPNCVAAGRILRAHGARPTEIVRQHADGRSYLVTEGEIVATIGTNRAKAVGTREAARALGHRRAGGGHPACGCGRSTCRSSASSGGAACAAGCPARAAGLSRGATRAAARAGHGCAAGAGLAAAGTAGLPCCAACAAAARARGACGAPARAQVRRSDGIRRVRDVNSCIDRRIRNGASPSPARRRRATRHCATRHRAAGRGAAV